MNATTYIFLKTDNTYGGYDYLEVSFKNETYKEGNTRSHNGHAEGYKVYTEVKNKKELKNLKDNFILQSFKKI